MNHNDFSAVSSKCVHLEYSHCNISSNRCPLILVSWRFRDFVWGQQLFRYVLSMLKILFYLEQGKHFQLVTWCLKLTLDNLACIIHAKLCCVCLKQLRLATFCVSHVCQVRARSHRHRDSFRRVSAARLQANAHVCSGITYRHVSHSSWCRAARWRVPVSHLSCILQYLPPSKYILSLLKAVTAGHLVLLYSLFK